MALRRSAISWLRASISACASASVSGLEHRVMAHLPRRMGRMQQNQVKAIEVTAMRSAMPYVVTGVGLRSLSHRRGRLVRRPIR